MAKSFIQVTTYISQLTKLESWIGLFVGLIVLAITLIFDAPGSMSEPAWHCVGLGTVMAVWWSTEAIPIPATALLPIILIPALGLGTLKTATAPYANPTVYLFFGGFVLGLAMEKCNLHKRIALNILHRAGSSPKLQIAGFMIATAFISMWVSNTATAVMMTPIGLSVARMLDNECVENCKFQTSLLLAIAYSASIGGMATLIGTPPNALLRAFLEEQYNIHLGFGQWMLIGVPISIVLLVFTFWWLTRGMQNYYGENTQNSLVEAELRVLGPISYSEKWVAAVFTLAALAWIFQPQLKVYIPFLSDPFIAMSSALFLFFIPTDVQNRQFVMDWESARKLPWGILLLFGGGLSLAGVINSSTLASWLAEQLNIFSGVDLIVMTLIIVTLIIFLTEITSNTATAAAFLPLVGAIAIAQGIEPQLYAVPAAIAASCAFMLPVATPPNAIVFGTNTFKITDMIRTGFVLNVFGVFAITGLCMLLVKAI